MLSIPSTIEIKTKEKSGLANVIQTRRAAASELSKPCASQTAHAHRRAPPRETRERETCTASGGTHSRSPASPQPHNATQKRRNCRRRRRARTHSVSSWPPKQPRVFLFLFNTLCLVSFVCFPRKSDFYSFPSYTAYTSSVLSRSSTRTQLTTSFAVFVRSASACSAKSLFAAFACIHTRLLTIVCKTIWPIFRENRLSNDIFGSLIPFS